MTRRADKINILGVRISAINMDRALQQMERWINAEGHHYICVCPNHTIMESQKDKKLHHIVNSSGLATPDGMSVVWACKFFGHPNIERVYGPDLMLALCQLSAQTGYSHYFYGGASGVPELLAERLTARFPGLKVAGSFSPPFRPLTSKEDTEIAARINAAAPDVVWVGLGTPKQDLWMAAHRSRLDASVLIGVGAAFDFHTGRQKQAPRWMQRNGLEWLFRLVQEPRRLWCRYLVYNPLFVALVFAQAVGLRKYELE